MFFKIGVLKNFAVLEPFSQSSCRPTFTEHVRWLLLDFHGSKFFFQLNLVFTGHSCIGFCPGLLWKHKLNLISSHWSCLVKIGVLRHFANFTWKHLCWSFFLIETFYFLLEKRLQHRCFPVEFAKFLRTTNLKSGNDCFWILFFHLEWPS